MEVSNTCLNSRVGLDVRPHSELVDVLKAFNKLAICCYSALRVDCNVISICCVTLCTFRSYVSQSLSIIVELSWPWVLTVPICSAIKWTLASAWDRNNRWVKYVHARKSCIRSIAWIWSCESNRVVLDSSEVCTFPNIHSSHLGKSRSTYNTIPHHRLHRVRRSLKSYDCAYSFVIDRYACLLTIVKMNLRSVSTSLIHFAIIVFITILTQHFWHMTSSFMGRPHVFNARKSHIAIKMGGATFSLPSSSADPIVANHTLTSVMVIASPSSS